MADAGDLIARLGLDSSQFLTAIEQAGTAAEALSTQIGTAMEGIGSSIGALQSSFVALGAALELKEFISQAQQYAQEIRNLTAAFSTLQGSTATARATIQQLADIAEKSPFKFDDVAEAAKRMMQLGVSTQDTMHAIQAIVDTAAGLRLPAASIGEIANSLAVMTERGVTARSMMTLITDGVPAWKILAQAIGTDIPTAMQQVKAGAIDTATLFNALIDGMEKQNAGKAALMAATWQGTWKNIQEGAVQAFGNVLQSVNDVLNKIAPLFAPVIAAIQEFKDLWAALPGPLKDALVTFGLVAAGIAAIGAAFTVLAPLVTAAVAAVGALVAPFGLVAVAVAGVVAALVGLGEWISSNWDNITSHLATAWDQIRQIWQGTWNDIVSALTTVWNSISGVAETVWGAVVNFFRNLWNDVSGAFTSVWNGIVGTLTDIWNSVLSVAQKVWNDIVNFFAGIWDPVKSYFQDSWNAITGWLTGAWDKLSQTAQTIWTAITGIITTSAQQSQQATQQLVDNTNKTVDTLAQLDQQLRKIGVQPMTDLRDKLDQVTTAVKAAQAAVDAAAPGTQAYSDATKNLAAAQVEQLKAQTAIAEGSKNLTQFEKEQAQQAAAAERQRQQDIKAAQELQLKSISLTEQELAQKMQWEATQDRVINKMHEQALVQTVIGETTLNTQGKIVALAHTQEQAFQQTMTQLGRVRPDLEAIFTSADEGRVRMANMGETSTSALKNIADNAVLTRDAVALAFSRGQATADDLTTATIRADTAVRNYKLSVDGVREAFATLGQTPQAQLEQQVKDADAAAVALKTAYDQGKVSLADYLNALDDAHAKHVVLHNYLTQDMTDAFKGLGLTGSQQLEFLAGEAERNYEKIRASATSSSGDIAAAAQRNTDAQQKWQDSLTSLQQSYHDLGVQSATDLDRLRDRAIQDFNDIAQSADPNSLIYKEAWIKATQAIYDDFTQKGGQLTEAQKAQLDQMETDVKTSLESQKSMWLTAYDSVKTGLNNAVGSMVDMLITGNGSFQQIMLNMFDNIAKAVVEKLFQPWIDAIANFVATGISKLLGSLSDVLGGVIGLGAKAAETLPNVGLDVEKITTDFIDLGDAASTAGQAAATTTSTASSAAGAIGGLISTVSSVVGIVTGIISAVANVIQIFQLSNIEDSLHGIHNDTTALEQAAVQQYFPVTMSQLGDIRQSALGIDDKFNSWNEILVPIWQDMGAHITLLDLLWDVTGGLNHLADIDAAIYNRIGDLIAAVQAGAQNISVAVTATGVTTQEAAKALGDQIAANLSGQLVVTH